MNFFVKRLLPLLLALLMLPVVVGCDNQGTAPKDTSGGDDGGPTSSGEGSETETDAAEAFLDIVIKGKSDFKIVYPEGASEEVMAAVTEVKEGFETYTGAKLTYTDDFVSHSIKENTYEILIGATNREASQKWLGELRHGEFVFTFEGTKLVICGSNDKATKSATNYFVRQVLRRRPDLESGMTDGTFRFLESDFYKSESSFGIKSALIDGVSIENYRIVISSDADSENYVAALLNQHIKLKTGAILPIVTDKQPKADCEILIGNTNRTTVTPKNDEYLIEVTDKCLQLTANTDFGLIEVYFAIIEQIMPNSVSSVDLKRGYRLTGKEPIPEGLEHQGDLRILYHNVWGYSAKDYPVYDRADLMLAAYRAYTPEIIGWQEANNTHRKDDRSKNLMNWLKENYTEICYPSNGGLGNPIFYRKDAGLTLLDSGYSRARSGDKGTTWAVFKREDGTIFGMTNSHFAANTNANNDPNLGNQYRIQDAQNMLEAIKGIRAKYGDITIISGGDYNSNPSSGAYTGLTNGGLVNVRNIAAYHTPYSAHHTVSAPNSTTKLYGIVMALTAGVGAAIDHIMHSGKEVTIHCYRILDDPISLTSSDHAPHYVDITFD